MDFRILQGIPEPEILIQIEQLYASIFDDADLYFFNKRYSEMTGLITVLGFHGDSMVGFKTGYRYNKNTFYSWVGGVLKPYRKQGIGTLLAQAQEQQVRQNGYQILRTKSMNRFKSMMRLNLRNGFDIIQVYTNESGQTKIVFQKLLN